MGNLGVIVHVKTLVVAGAYSCFKIFMVSFPIAMSTIESLILENTTAESSNKVPVDVIVPPLSP